MFQLTKEEFNHLEALVGAGKLKSQIAISSSGWGGRRSRPYAFTEHGVAMLSSVLRSERLETDPEGLRSGRKGKNQPRKRRSPKKTCQRIDASVPYVDSFDMSASIRRFPATSSTRVGGSLDVLR